MMKKEINNLKIIHKKESSPVQEPVLNEHIVKLMCEELTQILDLLDAAFEKMETPSASDNPPQI